MLKCSRKIYPEASDGMEGVEGPLSEVGEMLRMHAVSSDVLGTGQFSSAVSLLLDIYLLHMTITKTIYKSHYFILFT